MNGANIIRYSIGAFNIWPNRTNESEFYWEELIVIATIFDYSVVSKRFRG